MDKWQQEDFGKMEQEVEAFMEEVYSNPEVADAVPSSKLRERVFAEIQVRNAEKNVEKFTEEEKELIYLGRIYKRRKKMHKMVLIAAVMTLVLAFGITSLGGPQKIFESFKIMTMGREQVQINSTTNVVEDGNLLEDKAYEDIEEKFGFLPIKIDYLPEGLSFLEAVIEENTQNVYLLYGQDENVKISFQIRPKYSDGSWGKDVEDELSEEFDILVDNVNIHVKKYLVENGVERWLATFDYNSANYSLMMMDMDRKEIEKILNNLYFF